MNFGVIIKCIYVVMRDLLAISLLKNRFLHYLKKPVFWMPGL